MTKNSSGYCSQHGGGQAETTPQNNYNQDDQSAQTFQCLAITIAGNRCKRMTKNSSGYCNQHGGY